MKTPKHWNPVRDLILFSFMQVLPFTSPDLCVMESRPWRIRANPVTSALGMALSAIFMKRKVKAGKSARKCVLRFRGEKVRNRLFLIARGLGKRGCFDQFSKDRYTIENVVIVFSFNNQHVIMILT